MYNNAKTDTKNMGGSILSHFTTQSRSDYEKAVYAYLRMIIMKNMPLAHILDEELRNFLKYNVAIGTKILTEIIFKLVELVETKIGTAMNHTVRAILFDG